MLEAFQSLRDKLSSKVVQTSASASRRGTSAVNLDLPPPRPTTNPQTEDMDVDYGPALPPGFGSDHQNFSDQNSNASEVPSKKASDRPKRHSHSHRKHDVGPRSASDQYSDESDQPRMSSTKPKKHADKSKYKSRSRYVSSSSEEDQPSVAKHRSSKPSGAQPSGANSDQDQSQHDPDPPYYREVALADVPYQEACEYLDLWNKTLLIQHRALTCLSKSLAHILQRELYSTGNTGLLRPEAKMTLLHSHLGEMRCQELTLLAFFLVPVSTCEGGTGLPPQKRHL